MPNIEAATKQQLARLVLKHCRNYLKDPTHQKEFEEWYFKKYGCKWEGKKVN